MGTNWQNGQYTLKNTERERLQRTKKILSKIKPVSFLESHIMHSQWSYVFKDRNRTNFPSNMHIHLFREGRQGWSRGSRADMQENSRGLEFSSWASLASTSSAPSLFELSLSLLLQQVSFILSILERRKLGHTEIKKLSQNDIAGKGQSYDLIQLSLFYR